MEKITIELHEKDGFTVSQGSKSAIGLGYDEMLGLISAMTLPEKRGILHWLRTEEQRIKFDEALKLQRLDEKAKKEYKEYYEVGTLHNELLKSSPLKDRGGDQDIDKLR